MVVLSKKRIIIVVGMLMIAVFSFMIQTTDTNKTVETVALPVSNKVVVIDAGHRKAR